jgi:hypothetical protein
VNFYYYTHIYFVYSIYLGFVALLKYICCSRFAQNLLPRVHYIVIERYSLSQCIYPVVLLSWFAIYMYCSRFAQNLLSRAHSIYDWKITVLLHHTNYPYLIWHQYTVVVGKVYLLLSYIHHDGSLLLTNDIYIYIWYTWMVNICWDPVQHMYMWLKDNGPLPHQVHHFSISNMDLWAVG